VTKPNSGSASRVPAVDPLSKTVKRHGIVVAVDGSVASNAAVSWAAHEGAIRHIPLTLVHMVKPSPPVLPEMSLSAGAMPSNQDEGRRVLEEAVKIAEDASKASGKIDISKKLTASPPVPTLAEMSEHAEMIVVGCTGRGALARVFLGSVSSGVVRSAKCPVAVVRGEASSLTHPEQAPVLVGVDCSPASELALAIAFEEASLRGVELTALHASCFEVLEFPGPGWESVQSDAERNLADYLADWHKRYPDVQVTRDVVFDHPSRALIEKSTAAQLVVVGSHGRGGLTGMLLGSVSNAVVHAVHVPVIVARPS
jgi:nucleotide-binding universal stress UspA family protein